MPIPAACALVTAHTEDPVSCRRLFRAAARADVDRLARNLRRSGTRCWGINNSRRPLQRKNQPAAFLSPGEFEPPEQLARPLIAAGLLSVSNIIGMAGVGLDASRSARPNQASICCSSSRGAADRKLLSCTIAQRAMVRRGSSGICRITHSDTIPDRAPGGSCRDCPWRTETGAIEPGFATVRDAGEIAGRYDELI